MNALNESSVSRILDHINAHDTGFISAWRDKKDCNTGESYTRAEKKEADKKLRVLLQNLGYSITRIHGSYVENFGTKIAKNVSEDSYFVVDLKDSGSLLDDLIKLGEAFEQDSILFIPKGGQGAKLYGTNHCEGGFPGWGNTLDMGEIQGGESEFYSRVGSRAFKFENIERLEEIPGPSGWLGKMGSRKLAEVYAQELGFEKLKKK